MDKFSQTNECVTLERCQISQLLFADDLVLPAFSKSGLQHALNGFAATCNITEMKVKISKTELLHFSRNSVQCSLQVGRVSLNLVEKFNYVWVAFTSDRRQDKELDA